MNKNSSILKSSLSVFGYHVGGLIISCIFCIGLGSLLSNTIGQIISQIIILVVYSLPIYQTVWGIGHSDMNKENFGHIKKDSLRGFKIGLISSIPVFIMTLLFVLSKFNLIYNFTWVFKFANAEIWPLINMIEISMYLPDYSYLEIFGVAAVTLIPTILIGSFYIMGNNDFSPVQKLIYKKKPDEKNATSSTPKSRIK